ncbi:hypothetical protein SD70_07385 [Gordoniibacillus kamchatkensis]|uniref:Lipoprotein signal peptidase n=2 Tax=Gordoniibacillus kamchatkensis TaxID=1590651 RepID=A0ABR5AKA8_9BACL|nr:hypothetical protein SD70_07385 [Paenibacillus sp. VKM B-2647]
MMTAADQITKLFVRAWMQVGDTYTLVPGIIQFTYYENSGAARSLFQGYGRLFGIVAVIVIIGVLLYRKNNFPKRRFLDIGLAFLVAGAAGNGLERLLYGKVTDFLVFGSGHGILNVADLSINVGVVTIILHHLLFARSPVQKQVRP